MKLLALTPWPFIPAQSGGPERCYNLLNGLDEVTAFALDWSGPEHQNRYGNINYKVIPADQPAKDQAKRLMANGLHSHDPLASLTARNLKTIKAEIRNTDPDLIILEHPWLIDLIGDIPFIYDAHNFETGHSKQMFGTSTLDIDVISNLEARAVRQAEHITYCAETDWEQINKTFPHDTPGTLIPNGATLGTPTNGQTRNLIFIGSMYGPNIDAARQLINLAPDLPEYTIQILGPCAYALSTDALNVQLVGTVTDAKREQYFEQAHQFINIVTTGSGTHLKIARALAHGIPVVTTPIGSRGYVSPTIIGTRNIADTIKEVTATWQTKHEQALAEAQTLQWSDIANNFKKVINGLQ